MQSKLACLALVLCCAQTTFAQKIVKVDFSSTDTYKDSYGMTHTAVVSGLFAETRTAIIAKAQQAFDAALGVNQIHISEGTGGDIQVIMSGENYGWYGNVGASAGSAIVDTETFRLLQEPNGDPSFPANAPYTNAVGETLAHEIAHRLGVAHNRLTNPFRLMTDGKLVPPSGRTPGTRQFTPGDVAVMTKNLDKASAIPKIPKSNAFSHAPPAGTEMGGSAAPQMLGDGGLCIDAFLTFNAPSGIEFGYISETDEFIFQAAVGDSDRFMTFQHFGPFEFAVRTIADDHVYRSSEPLFSYYLSDPNPYVPRGYQTLVGRFETPFGPATFQLDATINPELGGFVSTIPEPNTALLLSLGACVGVGQFRRMAVRLLTQGALAAC